jgi:hypothetical protein
MAASPSAALLLPLLGGGEQLMPDMAAFSATFGGLLEQVEVAKRVLAQLLLEQVPLRLLCSAWRVAQVRAGQLRAGPPPAAARLCGWRCSAAGAPPTWHHIDCQR